MVRTCCVIKCSMRGKRDNVMFFRFPVVDYRNLMLKKLTETRQTAWLRAVNRKNLKVDTLKNKTICSRHFISGKSAALMDHLNPDWIPTLNMGYGVNKNNSSKISRYKKTLKIMIKKENFKRKKIQDSAELVKDVNEILRGPEENNTMLEEISSQTEKNFPKRRRLRNVSPVKIVNEPIQDGPDIASSSTETDNFENVLEPENRAQRSKTAKNSLNADDDEETVVLASTIFTDSESEGELKNEKNFGKSKGMKKVLLKKNNKKYRSIKENKRILPNENNDDGLLIESEFSKNMNSYEDVNNTSSDHRRERKNLNKVSVAVLKTWLYKHRYYAYPTEADKQNLADKTGLTLLQVSNWFINARRRLLPEYLKKEGLTLGKDKIAFIIKKRPRILNDEDKKTAQEEKTMDKNDNKKVTKKANVEPVRKTLDEKPIRKKVDEKPIRKKTVEKPIRKKADIGGIRKKIDVEGSRKKVDVEGSRKKVNVEVSQKKVEVEGSRKKVDIEGSRKKVDVEGSQKKVEVEGSRKKADVEGSRKKADVEGSRKKVEVETVQKKVEVEAIRKRADVEPIRKKNNGETTKSNKLDKITETAIKLEEEPIKISLPDVESESTKRETIFSSTQDGIRHVIGHKIINLGTGKVIKLEIYSKQSSKSKAEIEKKAVQKSPIDHEKKIALKLEDKNILKTSSEEKDPLQIEPEDVRIFSRLNASEPESIDKSDKEVIVLENKPGKEGSYSLVARKSYSNENLKEADLNEKKNSNSNRSKDSDEKAALVAKTIQLLKSSNTGYNNKVNNIENSKLSESRSPPSSNISKINSNKIQIKPVTAYRPPFKSQMKEIKPITSFKLSPKSQQEEIEEITPPKLSFKNQSKEIESIKSVAKTQQKEFQPIITFKNVLKDKQKDIESIRHVKPTLKSREKQIEKKIILSTGGNKKEIILKEKIKSGDLDKKIDPPNMNFENVETFSNDVSCSFANTNCRDIIIKGICKQAKRAKCLYMLVDDNENSDVEYDDEDYCEETLQEEMLEDDDFEF